MGPIIPKSCVLDGGFGAKMATRGGYVRGPGGPNRHGRGPISAPELVRRRGPISAHLRAGARQIGTKRSSDKMSDSPGSSRRRNRAAGIAIRPAGGPGIPPAGRWFFFRNLLRIARFGYDQRRTPIAFLVGDSGAKSGVPRGVRPGPRRSQTPWTLPARAPAVDLPLSSFVERRPLAGRPLPGQALRVAGCRRPGVGPTAGSPPARGPSMPPAGRQFSPRRAGRAT